MVNARTVGVMTEVPSQGTRVAGHDLRTEPGTEPLPSPPGGGVFVVNASLVGSHPSPSSQPETPVSYTRKPNDGSTTAKVNTCLARGVVDLVDARPTHGCASVDVGSAAVPGLIAAIGSRRSGGAVFSSVKSCAGVLAAGLMVGLVVVGVVSPAGAASNAANAKLCQKNGWQSLESSNGATFANQEGCVSYGAHGGQLFSPKLTITPNSVVLDETFVVTATGFHPLSDGTLIFSSAVFSDRVSEPTDANGVMTSSVSFGGCFPNGVHNITLTYTDAAGVTASTPVTLDAINCGV
jgi:hypothetical protein